MLALALLLASAAADAQPRRVERLQIDGNRAISTTDFVAAAQPWLGRELDEAEIESLRQALSRLYVERGYVSSGLRLAAAQPEAGVLRLQAVEGRLTAIELRGHGDLDPELLHARLRSDEVLHTERLRERFQLLLADSLLFARIQARLLPGAEAGEAVLDLEVERARPWQLSSSVHNHRPVSVGEWAAALQAQLANLSGRGDRLELTLQLPLQPRDTRQGQLGLQWQLPLASWGLPATRLQLGAEHSDAAVTEAAVRELDIESRLASLELGLQHALSETPAQRLALGLQLLARRQHSRLLGEPFSFTPGLPDGRLREQLLRFTQEGIWRSPQRVLALRSSLNWARSNVQRELGLPAGVTAAPSPQALFWTLQTQWVERLAEARQLRLRMNLQLARDRLLAVDGLAAGGARTVRGWRENQLLRDEGWVAGLEFEQALPVASEGWAAELRVLLTPFVDHGRLRNRGQAWSELSSWGLSLSAQWQAWSLELVAAKRLQGEPTGARDGGWQDRGVQLQLSRRW